MEKDLTLKEALGRDKAVRSYIAYRMMNQYTIWQLNLQDAIISVIISDNENKIVVIYNSKTDKMVYLSPHITLGFKDLWGK